MAAAAGAAYASAPSRWTAVSVALAADEAALSLEQEMHQAHAAIVGSDSARVESPATLAEPTSAPAVETTTVEKVNAETAIAEPSTVEPPNAEKTFEAHPVSAEPAIVAETSAPISAAVPELIAPATSEPAPAEAAVAAHELNDASSIGAPSTDAITAAVKELEAAAAAYEAQRSAAPEPVLQAVESVPPAPEPAQTVEADSRHEDIPAETTQPALAQEAVATSDHKEHVDLRHEEQAQEEEKHEIPAPVAEIATAAPEQTPAVREEEPEIQAPISAAEVSPEPASHVAAHSDESATPVPSGARGKSDPANKEPDIAETTAAAWASWRRIRESGDGKSSKANSKDQSASRDEAAMAVAAGAEKSPEDASASDAESGEIDSIVDSVLADLRPKIVEEISRKLGKKK
jgi:hypothetical protein